jgi:hypothetical protein
VPLIVVKTAPLARLFPCRAFYDTIGDTLSVGIKQKGKFKSSLDGSDCSFDLTRDGKLLNIDIWKARKEWRVEKEIHPPEEFTMQNIVFPLSTDDLETVDLLTNAKRDILNLKFARERVARFVSPATSLIFELNEKDELVGFWLTEITDDLNFQKEGDWRRATKAQ